MWKTLNVAFRLTVVTLLLTGLAYPLAMTGLAQVVFPSRANGSLVVGEGGRVVGSELIGQPFHDAAYFQPRPSAAGDGYDGSNSSGSNLGPTSAKASRSRRSRAEPSPERERRRQQVRCRPISSRPRRADWIPISRPKRHCGRLRAWPVLDTSIGAACARSSTLIPRDANSAFWASAGSTSFF